MTLRRWLLALSLGLVLTLLGLIAGALANDHHEVNDLEVREGELWIVSQHMRSFSKPSLALSHGGGARFLFYRSDHWLSRLPLAGAGKPHREHLLEQDEHPQWGRMRLGPQGPVALGLSGREGQCLQPPVRATQAPGSVHCLPAGFEPFELQRAGHRLGVRGRDGSLWHRHADAAGRSISAAQLQGLLSQACGQRPGFAALQPWLSEPTVQFVLQESVLLAVLDADAAQAGGRTRAEAAAQTPLGLWVAVQPLQGGEPSCIEVGPEAVRSLYPWPRDAPGHLQGRLHLAWHKEQLQLLALADRKLDGGPSDPVWRLALRLTEWPSGVRHDFQRDIGLNELPPGIDWGNGLHWQPQDDELLWFSQRSDGARQSVLRVKVRSGHWQLLELKLPG